MQQQTELADPHALHDEWVRTVRDPAESGGEGVRCIEVPGACVEYEIAALPDGRFALHTWLQYSCGDFTGSGSPWRAFATRQQCVDAFVARALAHFEPVPYRRTPQVIAAREAMLQQLRGGLFGYEEPAVSADATRRDREVRAIAKAFCP